MLKPWFVKFSVSFICLIFLNVPLRVSAQDTEDMLEEISLGDLLNIEIVVASTRSEMVFNSDKWIFS